MATVAANSQPLMRSEAPTLEELLSEVPEEIEAAALKSWDNGAFAQELASQGLVQIISGVADPDEPTAVQEPEGQLEEGTWGGNPIGVDGHVQSY